MTCGKLVRQEDPKVHLKILQPREWSYAAYELSQIDKLTEI